MVAKGLLIPRQWCVVKGISQDFTGVFGVLYNPGGNVENGNFVHDVYLLTSNQYILRL